MSAQLRLQRIHSGGTDTLGVLYINGRMACFIVEDEFRLVKVYGETRIPAGTYEIMLAYSPKFTPRYGHKMLLLKDVPGFTGILIHPGNTEADTAGCLLPNDGILFNPDRHCEGGFSRRAYDRVYMQIIGLMEGGEVVRIEVVDEFKVA